MKKHKTFKVLYKTIFALLGFSAVVTEIAVLVDRGIFNAANFFSYFAIISNVFAFVILLFGAYFLTSNKKVDLSIC